MNSKRIHEHYTVREDGVILSDARVGTQGGRLYPAPDRYGFERINLCVGGKVTRAKVHRIVAENFVENPNNLPDVIHINGDLLDNRASNLKWVDKKNYKRR